jgi:flagellar protein FlbD
VILLTRLNGEQFALNPDLVERADATPDTVVTLVDGTKYIVTESLGDLVQLIRQYRAAVVADAQHLVDVPRHPAPSRRHDSHSDAPADGSTPQTNVVQMHRRER